MSIEETYDWAKKQRALWDQQAQQDPDLGALDKEITEVSDYPVAAVEFSKFQGEAFLGEVGVVNGDLIFHFFSPDDEFLECFEDHLADAFIETFKLEDRLCWDFVPELTSWVVRATGYGDNPSREELANRLFVCLQDKLEE